jgi:DNA ligase (NAD+)
MTSTAWSTRSTTWPAGAAGLPVTTPRWAIAHKFPAELAWTGFWASTFRWAAPARCRRWRGCGPSRWGASWCPTPPCTTRITSPGAIRKGSPIRGGKDIRVGDWVQVYRAGDVIPKVADVDLSHRKPTRNPMSFPQVCPECGTPRRARGRRFVRRCTGGLICPAQAVERLKHFVSRGAFDIEGLGAKADRDVLWRRPCCRCASLPTSSPLPRETPPTPAKAEEPRGFGEKSATNLFAAIDERRTHPAGPADLCPGHPPCGRGGRRPFWRATTWAPGRRALRARDEAEAAERGAAQEGRRMASRRPAMRRRAIDGVGRTDHRRPSARCCRCRCRIWPTPPNARRSTRWSRI